MPKPSKNKGRPPISKGEETKTICFRIHESLLRRLEEHAMTQRRGVSDMLRIIVEDAVGEKAGKKR